MNNTYQPLGRRVHSFTSHFNIKVAFRFLGFFFAAVATLANAADAFNIAQTIVVPFFFSGIDMGIGLIIFSVAAAAAISILYIYQEGISVVKGTEKLPNTFKKFLDRWFKKIKEPTVVEPEKKLNFRQRMACYVVQLITTGISLLVSSFWSLSVFAGVVALAAAMGFGPTPIVLFIAALTGAAQFSACFFQEGSNFIRRVEADLARWLGVSEVINPSQPVELKSSQGILRRTLSDSDILKRKQLIATSPTAGASKALDLFSRGSDLDRKKRLSGSTVTSRQTDSVAASPASHEAPASAMLTA